MLDRAGIPQMERHADRLAELIARQGRVLAELHDLRASGQKMAMPATRRPDRDADHEMAQLHGFTRHLPEPEPEPEPRYWVVGAYRGECGDTVANRSMTRSRTLPLLSPTPGSAKRLRGMHTLHSRRVRLYRGRL